MLLLLSVLSFLYVLFSYFKFIKSQFRFRYMEGMNEVMVLLNNESIIVK